MAGSLFAHGRVNFVNVWRIQVNVTLTSIYMPDTTHFPPPELFEFLR